MQHPTDSYFVRLDAPSTGPPVRFESARTRIHHEPEPDQHTRRRRRRRRTRRPKFLIVLLIGLGVWSAWASQRPGGISGTINGWIDNVRGDVAKVSTDPDLDKAATYFDAQYSATGAYPQLTDEQLQTSGLGVGISSTWCAANAVVIQGAAGGGMVSRLLLNGRDLGSVDGKHDCPSDLTNPSPWQKS